MLRKIRENRPVRDWVRRRRRGTVRARRRRRLAF